VASLEAGHPLLVVCAGVRGIAPVRAALAWTPVLAHAGSCHVSVFYVADSPPAAAYLSEWDTWREAGVRSCCRCCCLRVAHVAAAACLPACLPACLRAARSMFLLPCTASASVPIHTFAALCRRWQYTRCTSGRGRAAMGVQPAQSSCWSMRCSRGSTG
jgi:hypothetical protein